MTSTTEALAGRFRVHVHDGKVTEVAGLDPERADDGSAIGGQGPGALPSAVYLRKGGPVVVVGSPRGDWLGDCSQLAQGSQQEGAGSTQTLTASVLSGSFSLLVAVAVLLICLPPLTRSTTARQSTVVPAGRVSVLGRLPPATAEAPSPRWKTTLFAAAS
ncbi:hypothetical protein AB0F36_34945 [Streptomyces sp. NPDC029080]|uniref:hypothetical protein n=1 Tax=Streptomyces sp. NPDC029080 TaxID=3155017 RepID=UPI0033DE5E6A